MNEGTEKYPPNIQKLFQAKPPFRHIEPIDYPPEQRRTTSISPISSVKEAINEYITSELPSHENQTTTKSKKSSKILQHKQKELDAKVKKAAKQKELQRQLDDWNDPAVFAKLEREFMKDPLKTVFIARLDYSLTELDISKAFAKYGVIESIRVIRDQKGKSRGYGFIVYQRSADAQNCVNELCRTGLELGNRTILVDIERSRVLKTWKPRRLGGGHGGRGYIKDGRVLSAAASGRRTHIANNPNFGQQPPAPQQYQSRSHQSSYNGSSHHQHQPYPYQQQYQPRSSSGPRTTVAETRSAPTSIRDKYAKYSSNGTASSSSQLYSYKPVSGDRSIGNIRRNE
ncbi:U1 small nuclear ribonucleoprotein [Candida viswanathii]|uniref:U1 small nuclear ribonucleoprotein n=1 Tax=Candida viswanathii TaxID=5486 RepID=A0A367YNQ0_9ASCO|nr:U1 small nuclear ribonucleoprotein [Candida viswanathii]